MKRILLFVLTNIAVMVVLGMCFLGKRSTQLRTAQFEAESAQAYEAAAAGMESARVKLLKDDHFPPVGESDQKIFSYTENVYDIDGTTLVGYYQVTVDSTWLAKPYQALRVVSTGLVIRTGQVVGQRTLMGELDLRDGSPTRYRFVNWQDLGSL